MSAPWSIRTSVDEVASLGADVGKQLSDALRTRAARAGDVPLRDEVALGPMILDADQTRELDRLGRALHITLRDSLAAFRARPTRLRPLMLGPRGLLRTARRFDRSLAQYAAQAAPTLITHRGRSTDELIVRARPDVLVVEGRLRIVEVNVGHMLCAVMDEIAEAFASVAQLASLVDGALGAACSTGLAEALVRRHRARFGDAAISVGCTFHRDARSNDADNLRAAFESLGARVHQVGPGALEYDGSSLLANGVPITILVEECTATPTTLLRFGTRARVRHKLQRWRAFLRGAAIIFPAPHEAVFNKAFLAMLSEGALRGLVDPESLDHLRAHVAWTRVTKDGSTEDEDGRRVDLRALAYERQDDLVLKPIVGHTAIGVALGDATSPSEWRASVDAAFRARDCVLQQRLRPTPVDIVRLSPFERTAVLADFCPVFIDGRTVAVFSRFTLEGELTHFIHHEGGHGLIPVFLRRDE